MKERCRDGCRTSLLIAAVVLVPAIFHTLQSTIVLYDIALKCTESLKHKKSSSKVGLVLVGPVLSSFSSFTCTGNNNQSAN